MKIIEETNHLDLVVKSGETLELSNRTYQYKNVLIESGGKIVITQQSTRWFILWASGNVIIAGKILGRYFRTGLRTVSDKTPDGRTITHEYKNESRGGAGGNGGIAFGGTPGSRSGGRGAEGTTDAGGGGGSGGGIYIAGPGTRLGGHGQDATNWRGAPLAQDGIGNQGGDGGRIEPNANGGLIFIYAGGEFIGTGGNIVVVGSPGVNGQSGGRGVDSNRGYRGGGGGGGGAPGGEGGHVIIVAGNLTSECKVEVSGGGGGPGGLGGKPEHGATSAYAGENGSAGVVDWLTLEQWNDLQ
jgi:hypothetical protein